MRNRFGMKVVISIVLILSFSGVSFAKDQFSGYWRTSFGHLSLDVDGRNVTGIYSDGKVKGKLEGRLSTNGKLLTGNWIEGNNRGNLLFVLQSGGNSFNGTWGRGDENLDGEWIGVREKPDDKLNSANATQFEGTWQTNFGTMGLAVQEDGKMGGSFNGKVSSGTVKGYYDAAKSQLVLNWSDGKFAGVVNFNLMEGSNGLYGEWWYSSKKYGGSWYGVRNSDVLGCIDGNCTDGQGTYVWADGRRFEGSWVKNAQHGIGVSYLPDGRVQYSGVWIDGVYRWQVLSGDVQNGTGKIKTPEGDVYEGLFSNFIPEGEGVFTFANGNIYTGEVSSGQPHGKGNLQIIAENAVFEGYFRKGKPQGRGVYTFADGQVYDGYFRNGIRHGSGFQTWADGSKYQGQWRDDRPNGRGSWYFANGDVYEGAFDNGKRNGNGEYRFSDGQIIQANWKDDRVESVKSNSAETDRSNDAHLSVYIPGFAESFVQNKRYFLVYNTTEKAEPESGSIPLGSVIPEKEVQIFYHIVEAPGTVDEETVRVFLSEKQKLDPESFKIAAIPDRVDGIKQAIRSYRLGLDVTRIYVSEGEKWQISGDNLAISQ